MVIGGGLLGLEAAGALQGLDVDVHGRPVIRPSHVGAAGPPGRQRAAAAHRVARHQGQDRLDHDAPRRRPERARSAGLEFRDGDYARADVVVFTVGVRPRDELARDAALDVHPRGGILIDERLPDLGPAYPRGRRGRELRRRCASASSLPATRWRRSPRHDCSAVRHPSPATTSRPSSSSRASMSRASATRSPRRRARSTSSTPTPSPGVYKKLVLSDDAKTLLGGILVGDAVCVRLAASAGRRRARRRSRPRT